jgi:hypothetical protein
MGLSIVQYSNDLWLLETVINDNLLYSMKLYYNDYYVLYTDNYYRVCRRSRTLYLSAHITCVSSKIQKY